MRHLSPLLRSICLLSIACAVTLLSCNDETTKPPDDNSYFQLTLEDVSCTEAWVRLTTRFQFSPLALKRNGKTIRMLQLSSSDTVLYDDGLLPGQTYTYQAVWLFDNTEMDTTNTIHATTLDVTRSDFKFQKYFFGDGNGSSLYDVAIVNDTLAYAVGEIYLKDSTGIIDPHAYNLVKWDGKSWKLMRIYFYTVQGQEHRTPYPAKSIIVLNATDIWIDMGGEIAHWNGISEPQITFIPVSTLKLWAESSKSIYAVGYSGGIAHYDGKSWKKIESGTTLTIYDIWGSKNPRTGESEILCVASDHSNNRDRKLLQIKESSIIELAGDSLLWTLSAIWFIPERKYIIGGGGGLTISQRIEDLKWSRDKMVTNYYPTSVRGNSLNDVFAVGAFGLLLHFDGFQWYSHHNQTYMPSGAFREISVKNNTLIAVGWENNKACALIGRR